MTMPEAPEDAIVEVVRRGLERFGPRLSAVGLTPRLLPLRREGVGDQYSSELEVQFDRNGQIDDVVEFEVMRNGTQVVTAEEIETWLDGALADVCRRGFERQSVGPRS
jgi:hypothetical protein